MSHNFKVGQYVRRSRIGYGDEINNSGETFEVTRLMPDDRTGEPCYRVKSKAGERAIRESEIVLALIK
ncbi:hypothetical protein [Methylobacterium crusticola]|uniref:hypothetical protein n=1 Tax=Methylobacterium crusticola TaxID=1697972 RepID=UPI000FFB44C7|nr:hypothetical protein [Methylobacterium crusticola]